VGPFFLSSRVLLVICGGLTLFLSSMHKLIKPSSDRRYVDLTVSFTSEVDDEEDLPGPPVRYHLHHDAQVP